VALDTHQNSFAFTPELKQSVLQALRVMAMRSLRGQAELGIALRRAGLFVPQERYQDLLDELRASRDISDVIRLADGAFLVTVRKF